MHTPSISTLLGITPALRGGAMSIRILLIAVAPLALFGCVHRADDDNERIHQEEPSDFNYQQGCFFGCPLEQPLLVGSRQRISVADAGDAEGVEAVSSDDSIAEFAIERSCYCERKDNGARIEVAEDASCESVAKKHCDNTVLVHGKAEGDAELELKKAGKTIDHATVLVREAERARVQATLPDKLGAQTIDSVAAHVGDQIQLEVLLYDADGKKLLASDGVSWSVDDDAVAIVIAWLVGSGKQVTAGTGVMLEAKAEGTTQLTIAVPGLEKQLDVDVAAK